MKRIAPKDRLLTAIKKAEQATQQSKDGALAAEGIAKAQYNALLILTNAPGVTSAELARRCFVTPQAMNETVGRLERQGWITRKRHPTHRHVLEHVTANGAAVLAAADKRVLEIELRIRAALSASEHQKLCEILTRVEEAVTGPPADPVGTE